MLETILPLSVGIIVGIIAAYLIANRRLTALRIKAERTETERDHLTASLGSATSQLKLLQDENRQLTADIAARKSEVASLREQNSSETRLRQEQFSEQLKTAKEQFAEQLNTVREQFRSLAATMLTSTSKQLSDHNREAMAELTKPISESFEQLQKAIHDSDEKTAQSTASLTEQLRQVSEQAQQMDKTATRLTNALKGGTKEAGDWGELMLQKLLDAQGFTQGLDYDLQDTLTDSDGYAVHNDDTGRSMRPDCILHYPGQQDVIIDAKVSIKAYYDYVNETNEAVKAQLLERHLQSLRSHVKQLAQKDYSRYVAPPRTTIDFVIMFVPNEAALQTALAHDPKLWNQAFEKKVFISSTQNLFAILRMIQIAWRQHRQTENQKKIVGVAEQLLARIGLFAERANRLHRDIQTLQTDYDDMQKSINGTRGILLKGNELKKLGIKEDAKHPILPLFDEEEEESVQLQTFTPQEPGDFAIPSPNTPHTT